MREGDGASCHRPRRLQHPPYRPGHCSRILRSGVARWSCCRRGARSRSPPGTSSARSPDCRSTTCWAAPRASGCAIYANGWAGRSTIEDGVERAKKIKAMGFTAAKFDPFPGPWRSYVDRKDEDFAIDYVRAMRAGAGPRFRDPGRGASPLCAAARDPHRQPPRRVQHRLVRGAVPRRQSRAARRGAPRGADPDRHRRGALHQGAVFRLPARRAPPTSSTPISARSAASRR